MKNRGMTLRALALTIAAAAVTLGAASTAHAASSKNGVRLLSPKSKTTVPTVVASNTTPTFKWRVQSIIT